MSTSESVTIMINCDVNDVTSLPARTKGRAGVEVLNANAIPTKTLCLVLLVGACQVWITG